MDIIICPCIKVKKANSPHDIYIEYGQRVKITNSENKVIVGTVSHIELSQYEEIDDVLHIILDNKSESSIGVSYIKDINIVP